MALSSYPFPRKIIISLVDIEFLLSKTTLRTYLSQLYRSHPGSLAKGYLDLGNRIRQIGGPKHKALVIVLRALENSERTSSVTDVLQKELDKTFHYTVRYTPAPQRYMASIFFNIAEFVRPRTQPRGHPEIAYALSEWFIIHCTGYSGSPKILLKYLKALDILGAEMKSSLECYLQIAPVTPANLRRWKRNRTLRNRTLHLIRVLLEDHKSSDQSSICENCGALSMGNTPVRFNKMFGGHVCCDLADDDGYDIISSIEDEEGHEEMSHYLHFMDGGLYDEPYLFGPPPIHSCYYRGPGDVPHHEPRVLPGISMMGHPLHVHATRPMPVRRITAPPAH